jgi:HSP20 family protein
MNSIRWSPFRDMSLFQNQLNQLFQDALQGWPAGSEGMTAWTPAADIFETENEIVLHADLPGIDPKQLDLRVENNVLTLRGERQFNSTVERENFHRLERPYGAFARSFTLSRTVDPNKIQAAYKDGILSITLPKAEQARPKRIHIAGAA